jgi:diacylglycerol kinase family enzyme
MRVLCVLNPRSADGLARQLWPQVAGWLHTYGLRHELLSLGQAGRPLVDEVAEYLERENASWDAVAGVGGDGTHGAAINGLLRYAARHPGYALPPYCFIPLGTGNDIAKSLGVATREGHSSRDLRRAVAAIAHGARYSMDLGQVGDTLFANALAIGLDSRILQERNRSKRRIDRVPVLRRLVRGLFLYTLSSALPMARPGRARVSIAVDGAPWYEGPMVNLLVLNTRIYAGVFDFSPLTCADDGRLDVVLFTGRTDYLARYLLAFRTNPEQVREWSERLSRVSAHVQGRSVRISLTQREPMQLDGEEAGETQGVEIGVRPRLLPIHVPVEPV